MATRWAVYKAELNVRMGSGLLHNWCESSNWRSLFLIPCTVPEVDLLSALNIQIIYCSTPSHAKSTRFISPEPIPSLIVDTFSSFCFQGVWPLFPLCGNLQDCWEVCVKFFPSWHLGNSQCNCQGANRLGFWLNGCKWRLNVALKWL